MSIQAESPPTAIVLPAAALEVLPADRNPYFVYIGSLASGSRRTKQRALDTLATMVGASFTAASPALERKARRVRGLAIVLDDGVLAPRSDDAQTVHARLAALLTDRLDPFEELSQERFQPHGRVAAAQCHRPVVVGGPFLTDANLADRSALEEEVELPTKVPLPRFRLGRFG
jgi:hypothetical protein